MKYILLIIAVLGFIIGFFSKSIMILSMSFGVSVQTSFWAATVLLVALLFILSLVVIKIKIKPIYKVLTITGIALSTLGLSFLNNPFYPEDFENRSNSVIYSEEELTLLNGVSNKKIKCIFLATCPFCEIAAEKLNIMYNNGSISDIEFIYFAHPKTADSIVKSQNLAVPYTTFKDKEIFKLVNGSFPAIVVSDGDSILLWTGNDVNFACYDFIQNIK